MKKTSVITLNLTSIRIPLLMAAFSAVIIITTTLCTELPPIRLSQDTVSMLITSNTAFKKAESATGVFSMLEKQVRFPEKNEALPAALDSVTTLTTRTKTPETEITNAKVEVSNSTSHTIDPEKYLSSPPDFLKKDFSVLILHTHTTESYTPSTKYSYVPTDTDRTTDKEFNMVRIGDEIEKVLTESGIKVFHDTTINDYPSYNGSYNRSSTNAENHIKNNPDIKIVLDVHRDAIEDKNGNKVRHITEIDGQKVAKVMLVVGSNLSGLKHEGWEENMRFAMTLQKHLLSMHPSLCRPVNFRSQRFNQQLSPGAIIVEVGTNGNTLDEALLGAKYFAEGLSDYIQSQK